MQVHIAHAHVIPTDTALGHRYYELCGGKRITNRFQPSCLLLCTISQAIATYIYFVENWITNELNRWSIEWHWKLKTRFAFVAATCTNHLFDHLSSPVHIHLLQTKHTKRLTGVNLALLRCIWQFYIKFVFNVNLLFTLVNITADRFDTHL